MPRLIRGALIAALALLWATEAPAKPPIWIARRGAATIVFFGSVHLLPPGLDWRPQSLTDALAGADALYFELPIDERTGVEADRLRTTRGMLAPTDNLSHHLSVVQDARLRRVVAKLGVPLEAIERMRPWLAEITLSVLDDVRAGGEAVDGVEQRVQEVTPQQVRRRAFETAKAQIDLLAGAKPADQVLLLDETLAEIEDRPDTYQKVVSAWMAGDLARLDADALAPLRAISPSLYERLISDRNRRWSKVLLARLDHPGTTVVVVGVGHLLGPQGVPALLRAKGISVTGP